MVLKKQAVTAAIWEFFGKVSGNIISFIFSIILARLLSPGDFGTIAIISGIINIASSFWDAGLGSALIQRKEVEKLHYSSVQFFNVGVGLILFLLFFLLSNTIAVFYGRPELKTLFEVMSTLFLINAFGHVYRAKLRRNLNFAIITKTTLFGVGVGGVTSILLAYNGFGIWSLVIQYLVSSIISNLYLFILMREDKLELNFSLKSLKELWDYGFKMFLTNIIDVTVSNLDSLSIGKIFTSSILGLYYRAKSLNTFAVEYSAGSIMNVYFRVASHYQNQLENLYLLYKKISAILFYFTNFMVGFLLLLNKEIIVIVFTEKWIDAHYYFNFIIISSITTPISYLTLNTLSGSGKSATMLKLKIITRTILSLNLFIGLFFGIKGYMIGLILVTTLNFCIELFFLTTFLKFSFFTTVLDMLKLLIVNVIVIFATYILMNYLGDNNWIRLIFGGTIFTILYLGLTYVLKFEGLALLATEVKKIIQKK